MKINGNSNTDTGNAAFSEYERFNNAGAILSKSTSTILSKSISQYSPKYYFQPPHSSTDEGKEFFNDDRHLLLHSPMNYRVGMHQARTSTEDTMPTTAPYFDGPTEVLVPQYEGIVNI